MTSTPRSSRTFRALGTGIALLALAGTVSCGTPAPASTPPVPAAPQASAAQIEGVKFYSNLTSEHVTTPVTYDQSPGVGGNHSARWTSCGIYTTPVQEMQAVHSMEHGAVWLTYRPDLPADQIKTLAGLVGKNPYILLSPYPDQASPITATAWGVQLTLDSASDTRLPAFLHTYVQGEQTPEPGAPCTGGVMN
ncbi:DUF3105 domain-containing protein [Arthrobacter sp. UYCo732]|uniref:DUF3105 domain-containing protein n=1 Tax=Arthrobacter sp. UYCo732 TaxID=3156336 RepID=UPI0033909CA9